MREIREAGFVEQLPALAASAASALAPVSPKWAADRLSLLWLSMGHSKDGDVATAWLNETSRLLADLPEDIMSEAIDQAVKASARGYMPSVGEIRKHADPVLARRRRGAARLNALVRWREPEPAANDEAEAWTIEKLQALPGFAARSLLKVGAITKELFDAAFPPVEDSEGQQ